MNFSYTPLQQNAERKSSDPGASLLTIILPYFPFRFNIFHLKFTFYSGLTLFQSRSSLQQRALPENRWISHLVIPIPCPLSGLSSLRTCFLYRGGYSFGFGTVFCPARWRKRKVKIRKVPERILHFLCRAGKRGRARKKY